MLGIMKLFAGKPAECSMLAPRPQETPDHDMRSWSVTCHPTQVNTACLNPSKTCRCSIYIPHRDGRL